ncbi:MAG: carboxypeptidase regulatory-like domain-containing protein [Terracidiphilus sp.]
MMRFFRLHRALLTIAAALMLFAASVWAQETTGGLQGTVKDPSGAVIPSAKVVVTAPTLVGSKQTMTDASGYFRFANLPAGAYTITATAAGFETLKQEGLVLEVGHLPTINLTLNVGAVKTVVEVSTEGPMIDTTTTTTLTNIPEETLQNVPHGTSFQSVIQFAPAARNEPLMGNTMSGNGSGSTSPGNGSNGGNVGFSIGGGSDSENSYLVEGQETADIIGGYSHTNVPMDFVSEVQMKTSGVDAEYGGALGGVVNVLLNKGTDKWHGSVFTSFQDNSMNASPNPTLRYDPNSNGSTTSWGSTDPTVQLYQPVKPHTSDVYPGITIGGPLFGYLPKGHTITNMLRDRVFVYAGFNPDFNAYERFVNYGPNGGIIPFSQNTHTDYAYGRIDAEVTSRIRIFGSWLAQDQKQAGENLPTSDSVQGYFNVVTGCSGSGATISCTPGGNFVDPSSYSHTYGFAAPNLTLNTGADITITNNLVSTTRFGYFFDNYHDFGFPTTGVLDVWESNGTSTTDTNGNCLGPLTGCASMTNAPAAGNSAPTLAQGNGYTIGAVDQNFTHFNSNKATQFDEDIAWFHSGRGGTHNLKFGYQLHRNVNLISQGYNEPEVQIYPGVSGPYTFIDPTMGGVNCAAVETTYQKAQPAGTQVPGQKTGTDYPYSYGCTGTYGVVNVNDYGTSGTATALNHGFFAQDAWTLGHGITINAGLRVEREYLPAENQPVTQKITRPINFGWGEKIAPRIGAAWDVFKDGKMKVFGGWGEYYDQMKLNLAIGSYGGEIWEECWFALMQNSLAGVTPAFNSTGSYCIGSDTHAVVNWAGGTGPSNANLTQLESQNNRANPTTCATCSVTEEGTDPNLKPYSQHDSSFGVDYQLKPNVAFEARWDRRRLDRAIEDSSIFSPAAGGETFLIVNPGQGVNSTFNGFWKFLYGSDPDCVKNTCPTNQTVIPAARSYDGLEFRVTKSISNNWMGMASYTWSYFRGNYSGLTSSDLADGGGGRNAPNNSRAFDEPHFSWDAQGESSSGRMPTDRPNALKGYIYYDLKWLKRLTTDFGVFQAAYSGTPLTSQIDVGYSYAGQPAFSTDIVNRGKWIDVTQDPTTGLITTSAPYVKRTPWFTSTDFNLKQSVKLGESKAISFDATFTNVLNEHKVVAFWQQIDSDYTGNNFLAPGGYSLPAGLDFYSAAMSKYDYTAAMNTGADNGTPNGGPITINGQYGKPYFYQQARNIRLGLHFTF